MINCLFSFFFYFVICHVCVRFFFFCILSVRCVCLLFCQICSCSTFVRAFIMYFYCLFVFNHNVYCLCALDHIVYDMCTRCTVYEFKAQTCFPTHLTNPQKKKQMIKTKPKE